VLPLVTQFADAPPPPQHDSILLVEDDRAARRAMAALLRSAGYKIRAVATAEEALRGLIANGLPAIVIVDLNLPGMDGMELITQIQHLDPDVSIVLTTANDSATLQIQIQKQGLGYLRKPIDFGQLLQILRS
jgi:two-component system C4-dicarboxylate transport response regulator DctD